MKIAFLRRNGGLANPGSRWFGAIAMAVLCLAEVNLFAGATVNWISGGPNYGSPSGAGYVNGDITTDAEYHTPCGLAVDITGNYLLVADRDNNAVRVLEFDINYAFDLLTMTNYVPVSNLFSKPVGVALDSSYNTFVLNYANGANGYVLQFDGDGELIATNLSNLTNAAGIALDTSDNIYVTASNTVFKITPGGVSSIVATITAPGASLQGIVVKKNGSTAGLLAVCDSGRNGIYLIDPVSGLVTTNAGFHGAGDFITAYNISSSNTAKFFQPTGVAEAGDGSLIVTDYGNHRVKTVLASGAVTNLYGVVSNDWVNYNTPPWQFPGFVDGTVTVPDQLGGVAARQPNGVVMAPDGSIYVTEDYYHIIRKLTDVGFPPPPPPPPPPPAPVIGTVSFPAPDYLSLLTPVTSFVFNNDVVIAIAGTNGTETFYTSGTTGTVPGPSTNSSTAPFYQDGLSSVADLGADRHPDMTIKAITVNGDGESSSETSARFQFIVANPTISGNNAAQFMVTDITTNALMYYTVDGSDPTNDGSVTSIGPISSGATLSLQIPAGTNLNFKIRGFKANYQPSHVAPAVFTSAGFVPNTISFGFASGEASSDFVAAPGQTFYAPVTLTTLPNTVMYSLQFNLTVNPGGSNPGPALAASPTPYGFASMLMKPIPGVNPVVYEQIPPAMFAGYQSVPNPVLLDGSTNFSSLLLTNNSINLLGVGWVERAGATNLYDTTKQTLITYSIAHDDMFPNPNEPNGVIVGGYAFTVPTNAAYRQTYQIQIGRPSATTDGIGTPGSSVFIFAPTNGSLTGGAINAIKNVTVGSRSYLVGNVYPFRWFNAGDFGNTNLQNADVEQVFEAAVYYLNSPAWQAPGSDFFDAMDSCGNIGEVDGATSYYTNTAFYPYLFTYNIINETNYLDISNNLVAGPFLSNVTASKWINLTTSSVDEAYTNFNITLANIPPYQPISTNIIVTHNIVPITNPNGVFTLFDGNDTDINKIAFGDGNLDVCDVYVTYRRSLDPSLYWFQRFWTNGVRVAETTSNVFVSGAVKQPSGGKVQPAVNSNPAPLSITNTPSVSFTAGDFQAAAGQTIQIPVTASVFGPYPLRVAMLNISVVPLDGSPALATPISFSPGAALGTPSMTDSVGPGNYAAAWLNSSIAGLSNNAAIGTLFITIPANATSSSAYAVHFDHASASPNGLASFPNKTTTGLITLSSRNTSSYHDGIPDSWRLRWFGTINNLLSVSNACPSGDGVNNWQKYVAGVDPNAPNDFPSLNRNTTPPSGAAASIYWPTVTGKQYEILSSASLFPGNWSTNAIVTGNGGNMEFDDNSTGATKFYRVLILQ